MISFISTIGVVLILLLYKNGNSLYMFEVRASCNAETLNPLTTYITICIPRARVTQITFITEISLRVVEDWRRHTRNRTADPREILSKVHQNQIIPAESPLPCVWSMTQFWWSADRSFNGQMPVIQKLIGQSELCPSPCNTLTSR